LNLVTYPLIAHEGEKRMENDDKKQYWKSKWHSLKTKQAALIREEPKSRQAKVSPLYSVFVILNDFILIFLQTYAVHFQCFERKENRRFYNATGGF
jgi:hypothetical protein